MGARTPLGLTLAVPWGGENSYRSITVYVPTGYGVDLSSPVGTKLSEFPGLLTVADPASVEHGPCTSGAHDALWQQRLDYGSVIIAVDRAAGTDAGFASYVLRVCLPILRVGTTYVGSSARNVFTTPSRAGDYVWRAVFEPAGAPRQTTESRSLVRLPVKVTMRAKLVRRRVAGNLQRRVALSGTISENGQAAPFMFVSLLRSRTRSGLARPRGPNGSTYHALGFVLVRADGSFRAEVMDRSGRFYRAVAFFQEDAKVVPARAYRPAPPRLCAPPSLAPGGCRSSSRWTFDAESVVVRAGSLATPEQITLLPPRVIHANGPLLTWTRYSGSDFRGYEIHAWHNANYRPSRRSFVGFVRGRNVTRFRVESASSEYSWYYRVVAGRTVSNVERVDTPEAGRTTLVFVLGSDGGAGTYIYSDEAVGGCRETGGKPALLVGRTPTAEYRTLLRFILSGIPYGELEHADIQNTEVRLRRLSNPSQSLALSLHEPEQAWSESVGPDGCGSGGATWLVAAGGRPWTKPGGELGQPWGGRSVSRSMPRSGWDAFDAPALVSDWVFRNRPNVGVLLRQETGQVREPVRYHSDEGPVRWRPRLYVTYVDQ